jgi:hypothetical protein
MMTDLCFALRQLRKSSRFHFFALITIDWQAAELVYGEGRLAAASRCQKSARLGLARRGYSGSEVEAAFPWLSASNSLLHPRLDNIGATLEHDEAILHNHIFLIVGIGCFRARGVGPGTRYQLLGRRGRVRQIREHGWTIARRTLCGRSKTNSVRQ